ncbi:hypothetical protein IFM89_024653 [Coptis chinensis]|uniref:Uncharacterized protein n=1 Tax=Coptis chinensis TaxID=261450 RepID=A0A835IXI5_9MAGN|nr:hypothetical protein IFM89_024653 [Coptis chinensis]
MVLGCKTWHSRFSGLHMRGTHRTNLVQRSLQRNVAQIPGLNTLGISLARVDFAPYGLIHFGSTPVTLKQLRVCWYKRRNPGVITIANNIFGSNPPISDDVLAKGVPA